MNNAAQTQSIQPDRVQRGEAIEPAYRGEVMRLMTVFVDSELAGAAGFADMINEAPGLPERHVAAQIVADKFSFADQALCLMKDFGVDPRLYVASHPWAARISRSVDLGNRQSAIGNRQSAYRRIGGDKRLNVFHYPLQGWTDALVMSTLMGTASKIQLAELPDCSYAPLANLMESITQGEARHAELGERGLTAVLDQEGNAPAQASIDYWYPRVATSFGRANSLHNQRLRDFGLLKYSNEQRLARWCGEVDDLLTRFNLTPGQM